VHVCLFDIDGTLIRSGGAGREAFESALVEAFGLERLIDGVPMSGRTDRVIGRDLMHLHGIDDTHENWALLRAAYLQRLPRLLALRQGRVLPGIEALLRSLAERSDFAVGLLTGNMEAGARAKLAHHKLDEHFSFGAFGDHHTDRDAVAREAVEIIRLRISGNVSADRIWVIGDTPHDVRCARSIGARAVAVATGWDSREVLAAAAPDLVLDDLSDAAPLLERWG
jgi:phosphoglycolate phosphatase